MKMRIFGTLSHSESIHYIHKQLPENITLIDKLTGSITSIDNQLTTEIGKIPWKNQFNFWKKKIENLYFPYEKI